MFSISRGDNMLRTRFQVSVSARRERRNVCIFRDFWCEFVDFRPVMQRALLDFMLPHPKTPISHRSPKIVEDER